MLGDGEPHPITEITKIRQDLNIVKEALEFMISEEKAFVRDGKITLAPANH